LFLGWCPTVSEADFVMSVAVKRKNRGRVTTARRV